MFSKNNFIVLKLNRKFLMLFLALMMICFVNKHKADIVAFKQGNFLSSKVVIDPGHGGVDGGTGEKFGILEKNINLEVGLKVQENLKNNKVRVIITRDKDISLESKSNLKESRYKKDLHARKEIINKSEANAFVSIHVNSNEQDSICKGVVIYYNSAYDESKKLAQNIAASIDNILYRKFSSLNDMKTKILCEDYYILRETYVPGVLIEIGFITNPSDRKLLQNKEYKEKVSEAISKGTMKYLNTLEDELKTGILGF